MSALAASTSTLRLLVPSSILPSEGEETPLAAFDQTTKDFARSLAIYRALARPHAIKMILKESALDWPQAPESELQLIEMGLTPDGEGPEIEIGSASTVIEWAAVATAVARRTDPEHFLGGHEDAQRILLDEIRAAAQEATKAFFGEALPLVEVRKIDKTATEVSFLGLILIHVEDTARLSGVIPSSRWTEYTANSDSTLLVLDDPEAEGHGLREAVLGLSMLAVVFNGPAQAGLFDFSSGPTPVSHESQAKTDGTPLVVKSQKLVQPAPKIYPSGLVGQANSASRKVIVDVKAQRAYLFVDGKLAFETPVSTASKGRVTPRGTFNITEKVRTGKHSTIYKSAMPYWNRLDESPIGMHTGQLPGYPASHGCIRLPDESARFIFDNAPRGTVVQVVDALPAVPQPFTASMVATAP